MASKKPELSGSECPTVVDIIRLWSYPHAARKTALTSQFPWGCFIPVPLSYEEGQSPEWSRNFSGAKHEKVPLPHFRCRLGFRVNRWSMSAWRFPFNDGAETDPAGVRRELPATPLRLHFPGREREPLHLRLS